MKNTKIMFNEDWIHFIWTRFCYNIDVTEQVLRDFIYQYKDTQITDFAMNVNGTVSTYPSVTWENFCDKYFAKEENGVHVDYKNTFAKKAYEIFKEKNLDMYRIWIDSLREIKIRPWISFRINDCHGNCFNTDLRKSAYVSNHPELWRIRHREANEYYDRSFDFNLETVRKNFLSYIEETLQRYRPDGVEIDFSREAILFSPGSERDGRKAVNDMMYHIKELSKKYSNSSEMKINVLLNGNAYTNLELGLDFVHWAKEGLIDSLVMLPRWETINTEYEIEIYRSLIGDNIALGGGQQILVRPVKEDIIIESTMKLSNVDMAFGQAAANLQNGCDFVYLYNHMDKLESGLDLACHSTSVRTPENLSDIFKNAGTYDTAIKKQRRHTLTYDDYSAYWKNTSSRLPIVFGSGKKEFIKILTGGKRASEFAYLILGFEESLDKSNIRAFINCKKMEFVGYGGLDRNITDAVGHVFEIDNSISLDNSALIELDVSQASKMVYVEILITENKLNFDQVCTSQKA